MSTEKDRIAAMLALAHHPNTPQHEAETALAMASKLMQRHGYTESDIDTGEKVDETIVVERIYVSGKYRSQRENLLYAIALVHSCRGYTTWDGDDRCMVVYGRRDDIFAVRTLFAAADLMGARLLPKGDRSWRISWWKGFRAGIEEALGGARKEYIAETPGAGLVLADRGKRAEKELRTYGPPLRRSYSYVDSSAGSYSSGQAAGRSFGASGRSFGSGVRGELK
jgi:hypothetical protein